MQSKPHVWAHEIHTGFTVRTFRAWLQLHPSPPHRCYRSWWPFPHTIYLANLSAYITPSYVLSSPLLFLLFAAFPNKYLWITRVSFPYFIHIRHIKLYWFPNWLSPLCAKPIPSHARHAKLNVYLSCCSEAPKLGSYDVNKHIKRQVVSIRCSNISPSFTLNQIPIHANCCVS